MEHDAYLDATLDDLERLVSDHPADTLPALDAVRVIRRAKYLRSKGLLKSAPRLRRYVLSDLRTVRRRLVKSAPPPPTPRT